ncbi:MAG: type II toxin-antitoxin system VapC family toxin [Chitinivibrionales bacterium]|nr:type II toxin-antitoxin system VapC family toxin [Chitinivibrionales bacterium]
MNLVDSSGWLEYFTGSPNAHIFSPIIEDVQNLIVPSISMYEVFKKLLIETDENTALQAITQMQLGKVIVLDEPLALNAARIGFDLKLALADSIILATARSYNAVLYTQDEHFKHVPGVKYFNKKN